MWYEKQRPVTEYRLPAVHNETAQEQIIVTCDVTNANDVL